MEIALVSWCVLGAFATACMGRLPSAQPGNGTRITTTVPRQAGLQLPTLREKEARIPASTWQVKCGFVQQPTKAVQWDPTSETGPTDGTLPMQQPEGAQAAQTPAPTNDKPELDPVTEGNQDADPEPQELPPLQRSRHLC